MTTIKPFGQNVIAQIAAEDTTIVSTVTNPNISKPTFGNFAGAATDVVSLRSTNTLENSTVLPQGNAVVLAQLQEYAAQKDVPTAVNNEFTSGCYAFAGNFNEKIPTYQNGGEILAA